MSSSSIFKAKQPIKEKKSEYYNDRKDLLFRLHSINKEELIGKLLQRNQLAFNKMFTKEKSNSFFSGIPKGVYSLTESLSELLANYLFIVTLYLKENNYVDSLKLFLFMYKENNECIQYIFLKIKKNLPLSIGVNNISKFYPLICLLFLKTLSGIIKFASKFKKIQIQNNLVSLYLQCLYSIQKLYIEKGEIRNKEREAVRRMKYFSSFALHQVSLFSMWYYLPIIIPIKLLEKIKDIYLTSTDFNNSENVLTIKSLFNLGLLRYINGESDDAIINLENAKKKAATLKISKVSYSTIEERGRTNSAYNANGVIKNRPNRKERKSLSIYPGINTLINFQHKRFKQEENLDIVKNIELALGEIYLDKENYTDAFTHVKCALDLLKTKIGFAYNENVKERTIIEVLLEKIQFLGERNSIIKNKYITQAAAKMLVKENKENEKPNQEEGETNPSTISEIEKFFLFMSQLSVFQIKILNEFQPKDDLNRNDLPILFPNQFKDCLTFSQRRSLDKLQTMALSRYIILKDPKLEISFNNLNYELFSLKKKTMFNGKNNIRNKKLSCERFEEEKGGNERYLNFLHLVLTSIGDNKKEQQLVLNNEYLLYKMLNHIPQKELDEIIAHPELIQETVSSYLKEIKERSKLESQAEMSYYEFDSDDNSDDDNTEEGNDEKQNTIDIISN